MQERSNNNGRRTLGKKISRKLYTSQMDVKEYTIVERNLYLPHVPFPFPKDLRKKK